MVRKLDHFSCVCMLLYGGSGSENRLVRIWLCFLLAAPLFPPETHLFVRRKKEGKDWIFVLLLLLPPPHPPHLQNTLELLMPPRGKREDVEDTLRTDLLPHPLFFAISTAAKKCWKEKCMPPHHHQSRCCWRTAAADAVAASNRWLFCASKARSTQ